EQSKFSVRADTLHEDRHRSGEGGWSLLSGGRSGDLVPPDPVVSNRAGLAMHVPLTERPPRIC
ncbi:MAG TPA: hypothetical protein VE801_14200, partial [Xanthobacteraceae bacterium]|nr:hypothetical protein [Xanthobacteraceae bacterium]